MSATTEPRSPNIRLACPSDLPRIALVAASGFYHSPVFQYQRPYHEAYPDDTVASYYEEYRRTMVSTNSVLLVAEDTVCVDEINSANVYDGLRRIYGPSPKPGRVVVGVASLTLPEESRWIGRFSVSDTDSEELRPAEAPSNRDVDPKAAATYSQETRDAKTEWLAGLMRVSTLAVHPAYWGKRHGPNLIDWCCQLADSDGVRLGVSAAKMGVKSFKRAGFIRKDEITVDEDGDHEVVALWFGIREPTNTVVIDANLNMDVVDFERHM